MKKIVAIVMVIATITACFCIGANAVSGVTLNDGDTIVFKDTIQRYAQDTYFWNISFNVSAVGYNYNGITFGQAQSIVYVTGTSQSAPGTKSTVYDGSWVNNGYKTITIRGSQTITDTSFINWLYDNTVSGMPEKPLEKTIDNTKATFATTLTVATAIIAWLMANQIALVGLYMYILITLVLIGKRYIKGV